MQGVSASRQGARLTDEAGRSHPAAERPGEHHDPAVAAALRRANERIARALAEGLDDDAPAGTAPAEASATTVRPLLQTIIQRHGELGKVIEAFSAVDPVRLKPERLVELLEQAVKDVEQALDGEDPPPPAHADTSAANDFPVLDLVSRADLDPAAGFLPNLTTRLRPGTLVSAPEQQTPVQPVPRRSRHRPAALFCILLLTTGIATRTGPDPAFPPPSAPQDPRALATTQTEPEPAPPAPAASTEPVNPPSKALVAEFYATRGDVLLTERDVSAARKFYEAAANAGSARAALALARTYDPALVALQPDLAAASYWYRRAALLGGSGSVAQIQEHEPKPDISK